MNEEMKYRLQQALDEAGKKPVDLSRDLEIPKSAVSQYLSGKSKNMPSERLHAIAKYLDVAEAWLMGFDVPKERKWEKAIEEKPVETANKMADMVQRYFEIDETDAEVALMLEEFRTLNDDKKKQVREYIHFLSERV